MLLEVDSVDAFYGKSHILHEVSIDVEENEIVGLLGRNGAGKTTLLSGINAVGPRIEGDIWFRGESIVGEPPEQIFKRGIAWVPERRRVFPNLSVENNLKTGLNRKRGEVGSLASRFISDDDGQFEAVFDLFPRLKERRNQKGGTMSGGEQQMLAIGRALVSEPDLLLIDEPFEGLMPSLIPTIQEVVRKLRTQEMSILITEQKIDVALGLVDRVFILENGEIAFSGTPKAVREDDELKRKHLGVDR